VFNAIVVCVFAGKPDASVLHRPEGAGVIFRFDMNPVRTEICAFSAGNTPGISFDDIFANGVSKPGGGLFNFR
jgi:hypothetical protein